MISQVRERVLQIMDELDKLSEHDYTTFELALVLFLRTEKEVVADKDLLNDKTLKVLLEMVDKSDTIMSEDLKNQVDDTLLWEGIEDYD